MSLRNIYCKPSEFTLHLPYNFDTLELLPPDQRHEPICVTLRIHEAYNNIVKCLCARFELTSGYPAISPRVLLSSDVLCARSILELQRDVNSHVTMHCNEPCIFSTTEFLRDTFESLVHEQQDSPELDHGMILGDLTPSQPNQLTSAQKSSLCIVHLDHIRSETKYLKTLESWSQELAVRGRVINAGIHFIYIILMGCGDSLRELLRRWQTSVIDVDTCGRPCKERLMSVLCHQRMDDIQLSDRYEKRILAWKAY